MSVEVRIPELGESISEAVIAQWLKRDGDVVGVDEILCELETDKASVELPSPAAGQLTIRAAEGDTVSIGHIIATIDPTVSARADAPDAVRSDTAAPSPATPGPGPTAVPAPQGSSAEPAVPAVPATTASTDREVLASPAARRLIEENDIEPATLSGSGRGGRVTKHDVASALDPSAEESARHLSLVDSETVNPPESSTGTASAASPAPESRPQPELSAPGSVAENDDEERVRMSPIRRTIARRLVEVQQTAAILTTFNEIDMSAVMDLRVRYKDKFKETHGVSLGFMSFFSRACVLAAQEVREVNARIDGDEIVYNKGVHLGIAASTERGLVVPVVRNADILSLADLEGEIGRLAESARHNKLAPEDLSGGTFTISNGGVFGSLMSTPILNPPQSGILGMHKIEKRPVVVGDEIVIRPMMYIALSYDHRVVDGKGAVTFLVRVKERIENPERLLLEL
jgi:2-oxoglutarate dehydrogenase E2 component (dihydrolipoamide succinyltransferase)